MLRYRHHPAPYPLPPVYAAPIHWPPYDVAVHYLPPPRDPLSRGYPGFLAINSAAPFVAFPDGARNARTANAGPFIVWRMRYKPQQHGAPREAFGRAIYDDVASLEQAKKEALAHRARLIREGQWTPDLAMRVEDADGEQYEHAVERGRDVWRRR